MIWRSLLLVGLVFVVSLPWARAQPIPTCCLAWFTDGSFPDATRIDAPELAPRPVSGTVGSGVRLEGETPFAVPPLHRESGSIGFWVRPDWNGDDGKTHRLLRIGAPGSNGLLIEKSARGMLRFVLATPEKITAARSDVSHWRAGAWHHVVAGWMSRDGRPIGLPLFIDRVAVAGPVAGGPCVPDFPALEDPRVILGHETAEADLDELVFRRHLTTPLSPSPIALVYRDHFRTLPVSKIRIDPEPLRVPADRRVVAGYEKPFGLEAGAGSGLTPVTDFAVRYGQWAEFDAKPFIRWETTDPEVAQVDANGRVRGVAPGRCDLVAHFRGEIDRYPLEVIPADRPDLVLRSVSLLPRYAHDAAKNKHAPGDRVTVEAVVDNFGFRAVPAGTVVRFELLPEPEGDYVLSPDTKPIDKHTTRMAKALPPRGTTTVTFRLAWPSRPRWVRVRVDPDDSVEEISEANNARAVLTTARPMRLAYQPRVLDEWYHNRTINHVGSFCHLDWIHAQVDRCNGMLRDAVHPTTSPVGIGDAIRAEAIYALKGGAWADEPFEKDKDLYDGGFPIREPVDPMAVDAAILHEFGHTCIALPDLYGYPVPPRSVLLKDQAGRPYAGSDLLPELRDGQLALPSAIGVPCGVSYTPLMDGCHLHLHPAHAGQVHYMAGRRGPRFWGVQGALVPKVEQSLVILDVEDRPLRHAAVYVYHVAQVQGSGAGAKYFADRPKFLGMTDAKGRWTFPKNTAPGWDDPDTDEVECGVEVWNPFGRVPIEGREGRDVAFTPNVGTVEGLLLVKIETAEATEFAWLCLTDFNAAYFAGQTKVGALPLRTSLRPARTPMRVAIPKPDPDAPTTNLAPVAVAPEAVTVACGDEFTIDASGSHDPEGEPVLYRWTAGGWALQPREQESAVFRSKAPDEPQDLEVRLHVLDGLRPSPTVVVKVRCIPSEEQVVVPWGARWRYTTSAPAEDWKTRAFDASAWNTGEAAFGTGRPGAGPVVTPWTESKVWLRRTFTLPERVECGRLRLYLAHDDDVEVFVNGVLAVRRKGRLNGFKTVRIRPEALEALTDGENVIAVHVQNRRGDAFLDLGVIRR